MAWNLCRVCDIAVGLKTIMLSRMLKKSASLSCSFGLFGLSGLFGCMRLTRWTRQTGLVSDVPISDVLTCHNSLFHNLLKTRKRVGVSKSSLPTVATVAWYIVAWAVNVRAVIIWRPVDPRATQVEAESHRGNRRRGEGPLARRRVVVPVDVADRHSRRPGDRADLLSD
jgi:hypothetical protein